MIKHINEDISYIIYCDPSKYPVKDGYDRDGYSLLCNNIATTAIKRWISYNQKWILYY